MLTSDHGDSLGEGDRWGHQSFLFPEVVRIPLIISTPATDRARMTTDLGRVALLTDVTPTLMSLIGGRAVQADLPDGGTLFVPASQPLRSRRRQSFMVMSSYGPVFGLVRRGRDMYLTDLRDWQEYAFALGMVGYRQIPLTDAMRRVSQAEILKQAEAVKGVYGRQ